jgi:SAM-dependent methyltransferase
MSSVSYRHFSGTGAENYERFFVPAIALPVSGDLLRRADIRSGERVLDVACGTGVVARLAAAQVGPTGAVTGVDVAPDMIDVARAAPVPDGPPVDWHVGDATSLPLPDAAYDVVLCQMGLMFMEDRAAALTEMRRVLAPGGRLVVNTPGAIQRPFEIMEQAITRHIDARLGGFVSVVFSMHDPDAVATLLRDAGLHDVTATVAPVTLRLPRPAEFLWEYVNLTPMGPIVAAAPETARSAVEREVVDGWAPFVVDDVTPVEQPMVIAGARR